MEQDLGGGGRRNNVDESMMRDRGSGEVATKPKDVSNFTEMGDGTDVKKMENVKNSTKNGHLTEVR